MSLPSDAVLPAGSLILVTGANGTIATHLITQLLKLGYRTRGTVRDPQKSSWVQDHFDQTFGMGKFELVTVKDLGAEGALDEAVQGCDGVCHVASDVSFGVDPNVVVNTAIACAVGAVKAAAKEPRVKRFVLTSSASAARQGMNVVYDQTQESYNTKAVEAAWAPPPYEMDRAVDVYSASKTQAEQAMWKFVADEKPSFVANSVLPDFVVGAPTNLDKQGYGPSNGMLAGLWQGDKSFHGLHPQFSIDHVDNALLHVAALTKPDVQNERIFGSADNKTWTDWMQRLRRMYPDHTFPDPPPNEGKDMANITDRPRAESLLRWLGRPGWTPLEESLRSVCDTFPA